MPKTLMLTLTGGTELAEAAEKGNTVWGLGFKASAWVLHGFRVVGFGFFRFRVQRLGCV